MSVAAAPTMLINGRDAATIDARDRGLHYGDGLFETLRCERGRVRWLPRHMRRLEEGCRRLRIAMPDVALLEAELRTLAAGRTHALLKLLITRGPMTNRGYRPAGSEPPTRIISAHDWPADDGAPLRLGFCSVALAHSPALAGIKHLNRLESVLAQQEAARQDLDEVVLCGSRGEVVCGSMSNLIVVMEEGMVTPALDAAGVCGVMRTLALDAAAACDVPLTVTKLSISQLRTATAIFCTNVRWGVRRAGHLDGQALGGDPRVARLMEWIDAQP